MSTVRKVLVLWWLQLKMRSRSSFDGLLSIVYPLFYASMVLFIYRQNGSVEALVAAAVGAACMGVWSAVATTAAGAVQGQRRTGTLELMVVAPTSFPLTVIPATVSMGAVGLWSLVATLVWGRIAFGIPISFAQPFVFVVAALVLAFSLGLVGFLESIAAVRYRNAWAVGSMLEFPIWLICGFLVPLSLLPDWVRPLAYVLPPTWGVAAVRDAALGSNAWPDIALCLVSGVAYAAVGWFLARRIVDSARSRATLALT